MKQSERAPARIRSVTIEGFRSLRNIQNLELQPLTVLIGANGAGKSNLIRFFEMLSWMLRARNLQEFVLRHGGGNSQFHMGARRTPRIHAELRLDTDSGQNRYRFDLVHIAADDGVMVMNEAYLFTPNGSTTTPGWSEIEGVGKESRLLDQTHPTPSTIRNLLRRCSTYQFNDTSFQASLHQRWDVTDAYQLRSDGGNLAAVLLDLRGRDRPRYDLILRQISRVLPAFRDFVLETEAGRVLLRWVGRHSDQVFGSHLTSDGSLRLFCLVTLLNLPPDELPDVMFFDEPELGLHPHAIALVAAMFKRLSVRRQVFIATQSPLLLDCFDLENIIVANASGGETVLHNLPRDRYQRWLDEEYLLSDIWLQQGTSGVAWLGDDSPVQREGALDVRPIE